MLRGEYRLNPEALQIPGVLRLRGGPVARHRIQDAHTLWALRDWVRRRRLRHPPRRAPLGPADAPRGGDPGLVNEDDARRITAGARGAGGSRGREEAGLMLLSGPHPHALITNAGIPKGRVPTRPTA